MNPDAWAAVILLGISLALTIASIWWALMEAAS